MKNWPESAEILWQLHYTEIFVKHRFADQNEKIKKVTNKNVGKKKSVKKITGTLKCWQCKTTFLMCNGWGKIAFCAAK